MHDSDYQKLPHDSQNDVHDKKPTASTANTTDTNTKPIPAKPSVTKEVGGVNGPDPTRYGDWVKNGRCIDF